MAPIEQIQFIIFFPSDCFIRVLYSDCSVWPLKSINASCGIVQIAALGSLYSLKNYNYSMMADSSWNTSLLCFKSCNIWAGMPELKPWLLINFIKAAALVASWLSEYHLSTAFLHIGIGSVQKVHTWYMCKGFKTTLIEHTPLNQHTHHIYYGWCRKTTGKGVVLEANLTHICTHLMLYGFLKLMPTD